MHGFTDRDHSFQDNASNGRLCSAKNVTEIRELLANDPDLSQKRIAFILNIHRAIIERLFRIGLSLRKLNFNSIPHRRDDCQRQKLLAFQESCWNSSAQRPDHLM
jgi:hypothetical protein